MSPDFGRMQAVTQGALRSVPQASSRRTTASIVELRNQLEQNQQAMENRLMEQNQRMMAQMMGALGRIQPPVGSVCGS